MTRVLLIGADPDAVDYSDPALPEDITAEKIWAGIEVAMKAFRERGWEADHCLIQPADPVESVASIVGRQVGSAAYDCVVIGGGIRMPPKMLVMFEAIINVVRASAPQAAIAFNTKPEDSAEAAARWIKPG